MSLAKSKPPPLQQPSHKAVAHGHVAAEHSQLKSPSEKTKPDPEDVDEDWDDGGKAAEEIGKTFTYRSALSPTEAQALESFRRRDRHEDDDAELNPLPAKQKNATFNDLRQPLHTRSLGPDAEALCVAASSSGNMLALGGRHGTVVLLKPDTLELMDTISMSELASTSGSGFETGPGFGSALAASSTSGTTGAGVKGRGGGPSVAFGADEAGGRRGGLLPSSSSEGVVTALAFRPDMPGSRMQNVLLAAQGDAIVHLHVGSRRVVHTAHEPGNKVNALAMRADGHMFASAGSDYVVRVYDEATVSPCRTLDHGDGVTTTGHTSHVFSLAWQPDDPQILLSGGWDNRVLVWDLRVHRSVRSISGPHICGDALDVQPATGPGSSGAPLVLTGSWRSAHPLQLWDLGSGRLLTNLPWWQPEPDACLPYAARFGTGSAAGLVVAGGSGVQPMVRVYHLKQPGNVDLQYTVMLNRPVHALAIVQGQTHAAQPGSLAGPPPTPGSGAAAAALAPRLAVCCDTEVHTVALGAHGHLPPSNPPAKH
ncbi:hypothetical protein HYH03_005063 [Edaphochlamys debaryana]|uniref:Uncharacterized protein n=1 Tax=Edaphochlamys debaryana TaxID=47281 RepID=A0A836C1M4_9CHLO|nr:hypothetical protein HYH03_005063 [Edaphochlamys debaryana]|eukprot:KAG2497066.1 hypothetical protein HYH03_005063 [Edaphochlamys debaryana]